MPDTFRGSVRLTIVGRVQGVWFRGWCCEQAKTLLLDGWVRNRSDGSVEALIAGKPAAIQAMIELCHSGPRLARVDQVVVEEASELPPAGFKQLPTA